jgi:hypothetical protein
MRLSDLSGWQVIRVTCERCRHSVLLDPKAVSRRAHVPLDTELDAIAPKLRCSECTKKGAAKIEVGPRAGQRD